MSNRHYSSGNIEWTDQAILPDPIEDEFGGAGGFASATDYLKILRSICANDGHLLQPSTGDEMFRPKLSQESQQHLRDLMSIEARSRVFGLPLGTNADFGLGGILTKQDLPPGRKKGSMSWGGYPNLKWWIDRETGVCGLYASQLVPPGDPRSLELNQVFQTAMYQELGKKNQL